MCPPWLKFIYSEKASRFCEIFPLLLTAVHTVKSKGKISQNFVAFSDYMDKFVLFKKAIKFEKIFTGDLTLSSKCQIDREDFVNFCSLLGKY